MDKVVVMLSELMNSMSIDGIAANHIMENVERSLKRAKMNPAILDQAVDRLNSAPEFHNYKRKSPRVR
jgi:hypothetical protein